MTLRAAGGLAGFVSEAGMEFGFPSNGFVSLPKIPAALEVRAPRELLKCPRSLFWGGFKQK